MRATQSAADAARVESHMRRFTIAVSLKHKLPMADSIIYAAALEFSAAVWTQDEDFMGLAQVNFFKKTPP